MKTTLLMHVIVYLVRYVCGQNEEATLLPCGEENLSCSTVDENGNPRCLMRSQVCDGVPFCPSLGTADDEGGDTLSSLDCKLSLRTRHKVTLYALIHVLNNYSYRAAHFARGGSGFFSEVGCRPGDYYKHDCSGVHSYIL